MQKESSESAEETSSETFLQNRQYLNELEKHNISLLDKSVLTISSSALGLSLAFINSVIQKNPLVCKNIILTSWIFLISSIIMNIYSYKIGADETKKERERQDKIFSETGNFDYGPMQRALTNRLNSASLLFLGLGLCFLIWFSFVNLG